MFASARFEPPFRNEKMEGRECVEGKRVWMAELVHRPSTDPQIEGQTPDPAVQNEKNSLSCNTRNATEKKTPRVLVPTVETRRDGDAWGEDGNQDDARY